MIAESFGPIGGGGWGPAALRPLLALLVMVVAACDDGGPAAGDGVVEGTVTAEGSGIEGVTVELSGDATRSTITDEDGRYRFEQVVEGSYIVTLRGVPSEVSLQTRSKTATLSGSGPVTVDFSGNFIRTASISGVVKSGGAGLAGVSVSLDGEESGTTQTDSDGEFSFTGLRAGEYEAEISGYPERVRFPFTTAHVSLDAGDSHFVEFQGEPELTATAVIRDITRSTNGGETSVEPDDVHGRIHVLVGLDPGEDTPERLELLVGDEVVRTQEFASGADTEATEAEDDAPVAHSTQEIRFTVNTGEFDPETGEPRFPNGQELIRARLHTVEGGDRTWTSSVQVLLQNADTVVGEVDGSRGSATDDEGRRWIAGDVEARVLPVIYDPERQAGSVEVDLVRGDGSVHARQTGEAGEGPGPIQVVFPEDEGEGSGVEDYRTGEDGPDRLRVRRAEYADGTEIQEAAFTDLVTDLWIDNAPPDSTAFVLPDQGVGEPCCADSWVGPNHDFVRGLGPVEDGGVGRATATIHVAEAGVSDEEAAERPPVETGADLDPSVDATAYRAVAVLTDALENRRLVPLQPTSLNDASDALGALFGVDHSTPEAVFADGDGRSVPARAVNPGDGEAWVLSAHDEGSGFAQDPARASVTRLDPEVAGGATCLLPSDSTLDACGPVPDALERPVPTEEEGYLVYSAHVVDRAGNPSDPISRTVLRDTEAPAVAELHLPEEPAGGELVQVEASGVDDVDLHWMDLDIRFEGGAEGETPTVPAGPPQGVGSPFDGAPVLEADAEWPVRVLRSLEVADGGGGAEPSGSVAAATGMRAGVWDAAGNRGALDSDFADGALQPGASFSAQERDASEAVAGWKSVTEAVALCPTGDGCPAGTSAEAVLEAEVEMEESGASSVFQEVHFHVRTAEGYLRWAGALDGTDTEQTGEGRWLYSLEWAPSFPLPEGQTSVVAVGVDPDGAALRTVAHPALDVTQP